MQKLNLIKIFNMYTNSRKGKEKKPKLHTDRSVREKKKIEKEDDYILTKRKKNKS